MVLWIGQIACQSHTQDACSAWRTQQHSRLLELIWVGHRRALEKKSISAKYFLLCCPPYLNSVINLGLAFWEFIINQLLCLQ